MSALLLASCLVFTTTSTDFPEEVWWELQHVAPQYGLDPAFVWNIIYAESTFNARAETHVARGLMQITESTWYEVAPRISYHEAWNWRINLRVGCAYLAHLKKELERAGHFSYPMLAAAYHYGPGRVRRSGYNLSSFNTHNNRIYRRIFAGDIAPFDPPNT